MRLLTELLKDSSSKTSLALKILYIIKIGMNSGDMAEEIPKEKQCKRCKIIKPLDMFTKSKLGKLGCLAICKKCRTTENKQKMSEARKKEIPDTVTQTCNLY